jgi:hypothetical protein
MPGVFAPEVLADPIGVVVDLIGERKPGLDRSTITRIVEEIAGVESNAADSPRPCSTGHECLMTAARPPPARSETCWSR